MEPVHNGAVTSTTRAVAFDAYEAALDREEVAAQAYATLMRGVGDLVEIDPARQLAYLPSTPGARA